MARFYKWLLRAWPLLGMLLLLLFHLSLLEVFPSLSNEINETVTLVVQIVGGLLVLYSIDTNIGVIRGGSLFADLKRYLREFPLIKHHYVLEVQGASHSVTGSNIRLSVSRNPDTVEGRLDYLQEQIDAVRSDLSEDISKVERQLREQNLDTERKVDEIASDVAQLSAKVQKVSVGSIKTQLFGVMLLIYGAFVSYVA